MYSLLTSKKFQTKEQQELLNNLIRDSIVYDFNIEQTQIFMKTKIGVEVPLDLISRTIIDLKIKNIKSKLISYHENNNNDESIYECLERTEVIKFIQKELWQIFDKNIANPMLQIECLSEMRECTILFMNLYNRIFGIPIKIHI